MTQPNKLTDSLSFLPENLRGYELHPKVTDMINFIITETVTELEDVKYKNTGPDIVRAEVITEIIKEKGYAYITDVMATLTNIEFNVLLAFVSLISLLKGSRQGLELVLKLLGFDSFITEWWQASPKLEPWTYDITIIMNTTFVTDVLGTLHKIEAFGEHYVFPKIHNVDFKFTIKFAEKNVNFAGFTEPHYFGRIAGRAP